MRFLKRGWGRRFEERRLLLLAYVIFVSMIGTSSSRATDIYREPWHWSEKIPVAVIPQKAPPTEREPRAFEHLRLNPNTSMKTLIAKIGVPDAFAPQFCVTRDTGVPTNPQRDGPEAGTFRYRLRGGGEVFILVSDFHTINAVIRYQKFEGGNELYQRD